ncbi:MAG TPA: ABC transporter ATP-binding protein [Thermodesulfobacteriota bacterium]|nr:ABC transporter ATP-binding protein [Thermodesulfobacteriota bacterium]
MLQVDRINVFYGEVQALREVSLSVSSGEIVSLVGGNGAGKTTTLKTISGLLQPASGSIIFDGSKTNRLPPHRIVAMGLSQVPEGRRIFPRMSVLENLHIGSHIPEARKRREETLQWVFQLFPILRERREQFGGTLSGGEQQMLAIARGLMSRPKLLILDEFSLGLAPIVVNEIFQVIQQVNRQGTTIFLVEQNVQRSLSISHRSYVLENGAVVLQGEGKELLKNEYMKKAFLGM